MTRQQNEDGIGWSRGGGLIGDADSRYEDSLVKARDKYRTMVHMALLNCKLIPATWHADGDPGAFNGCLWARAAHLFGIGSTSAIALCREFGEDPDWEPELVS